MSKWRVQSIRKVEQDEPTEAASPAASERPSPRQIYDALKETFSDILFIAVSGEYQCFGTDAQRLVEVCGLVNTGRGDHIVFTADKLNVYKAAMLAAGYNVTEVEPQN